ncbi:MAG: YceI family protein [Desulfovibrionaceae bacterium]|nr:YceI family protein [Desulfovibrionaceae bacterium]MBF0515401.1 YceI family protein [Desulfovibrionaceae bacterium]
MRKVVCLTVLALLCAAWPASNARAGEPPLWVVDPPHCSIGFTIKHIYVQIPGEFKRFDAVVRFDPDNLKDSLIALTVDAASIDTGVDKRDEHLRSPEFFDAAKYPAIVFTSESIARKDETTFVAKGKLTIKDVAREVELPFTYYGSKESPLEKGRIVAGFESHFPVKLADYHVGEDKWQKMGAIGESAALAVEMELLRQ